MHATHHSRSTPFTDEYATYFPQHCPSRVLYSHHTLDGVHSTDAKHAPTDALSARSDRSPIIDSSVPLSKSPSKSRSTSPAKKSVKTAVTASAGTAKPKRTPPFEVRRSKIQGRGVFATRRIREGQVFTEYIGEPISHEEADRRYDDSNGRHHTFLFVLNNDVVLDARRRGNDAKYINHSCEPNCESVIDDDRVWIQSIKPIAPGTELVYDYRFEWDDAYDPDDVRYYACRCGAKKCRGTILRVPVYLRKTIREWLAGNDVKKPRKLAKKAVKKVAKRARKKPAKKIAKNPA